jgi:hypothetical protein
MDQFIRLEDDIFGNNTSNVMDDDSQLTPRLISKEIPLETPSIENPSMLARFINEYENTPPIESIPIENPHPILSDIENTQVVEDVAVNRPKRKFNSLLEAINARRNDDYVVDGTNIAPLKSVKPVEVVSETPMEEVTQPQVEPIVNETPVEQINLLEAIKARRSSIAGSPPNESEEEIIQDDLDAFVAPLAVEQTQNVQQVQSPLAELASITNLLDDTTALFEDDDTLIQDDNKASTPVPNNSPIEVDINSWDKVETLVDGTNVTLKLGKM